MNEAGAIARRERERLAALARYGVLDTPREAGFDQLAELASRLCNAPIAVVNLIGADRQWFKAEVGLGVRETPLDVSFCRHFLQGPGLTVIPDTAADPRFACNPQVTGKPGLRFYAGCPLTTPDGHALGTLCVLGHVPRDLDTDQRFALRTLADQVMAQLELRLALRDKEALLRRQELLLQEVHHRVRNSLQLVGSVIGMQLRNVVEPAARAALQDTNRRIRSIAAVHEQLHRTDRLDHVDLAEFLGALLIDLRAGAPPDIRLELQAVPALVAIGTAVSLALLVSETVTNSLKYAYPADQAGVIAVALEAAPAGRLRLSVRDYGRGLPPGFVPSQSRSLGMRLLFALTRQLAGEASIEAAEPGTVTSIVFDPATAA